MSLPWGGEGVCEGGEGGEKMLNQVAKPLLISSMGPSKVLNISDKVCHPSNTAIFAEFGLFVLSATDLLFITVQCSDR